MNAGPGTAGLMLCRLDEIEDGEAKGFVLGEGAESTDILVVREGQCAFGYVNSCPHVGTPLDWNEDDFMSEDGDYLMCHTHGALFRIEDGFCVAGPCAGNRLTAVPVTVDEKGRVILIRRTTADAF